jgi:hypothetical protein
MGLSRRKNRTLLMAKCMLYSKGIWKGVWGEAMCCENYILMRVPTRILHVIPKEQ